MTANRLKQEKGNVNKKKIPKTVLTFLYLFIVLILVSSLIGSISKLRRSQFELKQAGEQLTRDSNSLVTNQKKFDELKSSLYLEKVARDTLGLARENELVIQLPQDEVVKKLSPRLFEKSENKINERDTNLQKWLQLLF